MTDHRIHRSIAERYDIVVSHAVDPLRRARRIATWTTGGLTLLASIGLLLSGDYRSFEARPVAPAHQLFEKNCEECHRQPFGTLARLLPPYHDKRTVADSACQRCHQGKHSSDHYAWRFQQAVKTEQDVSIKGTPDCAQCHDEHADSGKLSLVADAYCIECHQDLSQRVAAHTRREFDPPREKPRTIEAIAKAFSKPEHPAFNRKLAAEQQKFRFNHALHLHPDGLPNPDRTEPERLECSSCHQPEASGEYMQPISFDDHCKRCHQLHLKKELSPIVEGQPVPLPHVAPEEIRGVLRGRLMKYAEDHAAEIEAEATPEPLAPPLNPKAAKLRNQWEWVQKELECIEDELFRPKEPRQQGEAPRQAAALEMTCSVCHVTTSVKQPADTLVDWQVEKPNIPTRWLENGRFPHNRHTDVRCIDCHYKTAPTEKQFPKFEDAELRAFYQSPPDPSSFLSKTIYNSRLPDNDVLIPEIDACLKCHGQPELADATGSAPSSCVSCHSYHHSPDGTSPRGNEHPERILPFLTSGRTDP